MIYPVFILQTHRFNKMTETSESKNTKVEIEFCKVCDYGGHCLALAKQIKETNPNTIINCKKGRQGAFEVVVNDKLIYSKLRTMALPNYAEVVEVIKDVSEGGEPRIIKGEQPINCAIS